MGSFLLRPYISDLQKEYTIKSFVNLIIIEGQEISSRLTTTDEDIQYLPDIFRQKNSQFNQSYPDCYQLAIPRYVELWISSISYVRCEVPFLPRSNDFELFFDQANSNPLINQIHYQGERIQAYHLRRI